jgi:hypothetical protein
MQIFSWVDACTGLACLVSAGRKRVCEERRSRVPCHLHRSSSLPALRLSLHPAVLGFVPSLWATQLHRAGRHASSPSAFTPSVGRDIDVISRPLPISSLERAVLCGGGQPHNILIGALHCASSASRCGRSWWVSRDLASGQEADSKCGRNAPALKGVSGLGETSVHASLSGGNNSRSTIPWMARRVIGAIGTLLLASEST